MEKLCSSLFNQLQLTSATILHGHQYEKIPTAAFCKKYGLPVKSCGLIISLQYPFLAASPDGLVESDKLIEVK